MSSSEGPSMPMVSKILIDIVLLSWKAETVGNLAIKSRKKIQFVCACLSLTRIFAYVWSYRGGYDFKLANYLHTIQLLKKSSLSHLLNAED